MPSLLKLLVYFSRTSRSAIVSEFRGWPVERAFKQFQSSILQNVPFSEENRSCRWEVTVDNDLQHFVMENAMTLELDSGQASALKLPAVPDVNTMSHRVIRCVLVPLSFSCIDDVERIRFVIRVVQPRNENQCFAQMLKNITVLERERAFITSREVSAEAVTKESRNWPSTSAFVNRIDTSPLQSLDSLYRFCSIDEVCIDFFQYFPTCELIEAMTAILRAGTGSAVTIPPYSIYLRSVHFRPDSLAFRN